MNPGTHLVHLALLGCLLGQQPPGAEPPTRAQIEQTIAAQLEKGAVQQALSTYDSYTKSSNRADTGLLRLIARAELERSAGPGTAPGIRLVALKYLARGGDKGAMESLGKLASAGTEAALSARIALLELDQKGAAANLARLLPTASQADRPTIIKALQDANARAEAPLLMPLLDSGDVPTRTAAALALGTLGHQPAVDRLKVMLGGDAVTKMVAAIALRRLGDQSMDARVVPLLGGILPEVRLMAAEAYGPSASRRWVSKIKELSTDRNELIRVRAAELLACCDVTAAKTMLADALGSRIPPVQAEAARVLAKAGLADARLGRRMLGSDSAEVRAHGAGAVLQIKEKPRN
jgi:hypothetical protein